MPKEAHPVVKIRDQLVPASVARTRTSGGTNPCLYITVHETANRSRGANAAAHANLQSRGNARAASWHYQVDDREIVRSYRDTVRCWHAGDGGGHGNMSSIGIEICVNSDGDYEQALRNAAELVRYLRARYGLPRSHVVQANHWSGKNCPTILRSRGAAAWRSFVAATDPVTVSPTTTPTPPTVPEGHLDMHPDELNRHLSRHAENVHAGVQRDIRRLVPELVAQAIRELAGPAVWGYKNPDLETGDAYQILRDTRDQTAG